MIEGKYNIIVKTPLGPKKGSIVLSVKENSLSGTIELFGKQNTFDNGTINGNQCSFSGNLQSPVGKVAYETNGTIDGDSLTANAKTKQGDMPITGTRA
jgi:hypothetical protein